MKQILVATRKGLIIFSQIHGKWIPVRDVFLGQPVSMVYVNPIDGNWWISLDHGHWGTKLHRSKDQGITWEEIIAPAYPEGEQIKPGIPAHLRYIWAFGADHLGRMYIGTEPGGLFVESSDQSFILNRGLWNHPSRPTAWFGGGREFAGIHSIVFHPKDDQHLYVGISVAGVFESKDAGVTWNPVNRGLNAEYLPDPTSEVGHDPHLLVMCHEHPAVLWQQNHVSIYRSTDGGQYWEDIGQAEGAAKFGFTIAAHQFDPLTAWVVPAIKDELRVPINRALCVCRTTDGGKSWTTLNKGLPQSFCYDLVYRHALVQHNDELVFGTTTGNLYYSADGGDSWGTLSQTLPLIYCLAFI